MAAIGWLGGTVAALLGGIGGMAALWRHYLAAWRHSGGTVTADRGGWRHWRQCFVSSKSAVNVQ